MSHFLDRLTYLTRTREAFADGHSEVRGENREWENGYRQRWQHAKIMRSTHGGTSMHRLTQLDVYLQ